MARPKAPRITFKISAKEVEATPKGIVVSLTIERATNLLDKLQEAIDGIEVSDSDGDGSGNEG